MAYSATLSCRPPGSRLDRIPLPMRQCLWKRWIDRSFMLRTKIQIEHKPAISNLSLLNTRSGPPESPWHESCFPLPAHTMFGVILDDLYFILLHWFNVRMGTSTCCTTPEERDTYRVSVAKLGMAQWLRAPIPLSWDFAPVHIIQRSESHMNYLAVHRLR